MGTVPELDNPDKMMRLPAEDAKSAELHEHIRNGSHCRVISYKAWKNNKTGVIALCRLQNYDNAHSLSDTVVNAFEIVAALARKSNGSDEHVTADLQTAKDDISGSFSDDDLLKMYKLGKMVSEDDVRMLVNFANRYVAGVDLRPDMFKCLAELPAGAAKAKIAALMANLRADKNDKKQVYKFGNAVIGNCIKLKDIQRFSDAALQGHLLDVEAMLVDLHVKYKRKTLELTVPADAHNKSMVELMVRVARVLFLSSWKDDKSVQNAHEKLSAAEDKLRASLTTASSSGSGKLPSRLLPEVESKTAATKEDTKSDDIGLEHMPAMQFLDGKLVVDNISQSLAAGISIGSKVFMDKLANGGRPVGRVIAITSDHCEVCWDVPKLIEETKFAAVNLKFMQTTVIESAQPTKKRKFAFVDDDFIKCILIERVCATMHTIYAQCCHQYVDPLVECIDGNMLRLKCNFKKDGLILAPPASAVLTKRPDKKALYRD